MTDIFISDDDLNTANGLVNFQILATDYSACDPAQAYMSYAISEGWTLQGLIDNAVVVDAANAVAWGYWCRTAAISAHLSNAVLQEFSKACTVLNPDQDPLSGTGAQSYAWQLDIYLGNGGFDGIYVDSPDFSPPVGGAAEHLMLRQQWYSAYDGGTVYFPTIEQQVADGEVTLVPVDEG